MDGWMDGWMNEQDFEGCRHLETMPIRRLFAWFVCRASHCAAALDFWPLSPLEPLHPFSSRQLLCFLNGTSPKHLWACKALLLKAFLKHCSGLKQVNL